MRTGDNIMDREGGSGDSHHSDHGLSDALSDHRDDATSSGASTPRGDVPPSVFGVFSNIVHEEHTPVKHLRDSGDGSEGKPGIQKIITSKAEAWMSKKGMSWPWKGNEQGGSEARTARFGWPWLQHDQENESVGHHRSPAAKPEIRVAETNRTANNEASRFWSPPLNVNSTSSASSCGSTTTQVDTDSAGSDYEISWEDLKIGEQIGQGIIFPVNM